MENEPCRRSSALQELFHWKSIEWEGLKSPSKILTPSSLLSARNRAFLELGATPKEL